MEGREGRLDSHQQLGWDMSLNKKSVCRVWNRSYTCLVPVYWSYVISPMMYCIGSNRGGVRGRVTTRYGA